MLRVVEAAGSAAERGGAIGRALADKIHRSLAFYRAQLEDIDLARLVAPYRLAAERALPDYLAMLDATAAAAEAPRDELFAVNAWEELEPLLEARAAAVERCTSFTAVAPGATILAHAEHWYAGDAGNVALVVEHPDGGSPALASPTVACCLPAVGMNAHRVAQGIDSLAATDDREGVPRVLVSRHALEARDRTDAVRRAGLGGRAGGYGHVFALPGGETFSLETTAERLTVVEGPGGHTNHYLDPELAEVGSEPSESSLARHARVAQLLAERAPRTPQEAMETLRDDGLAPQDDPDTAVLFAMVCEVESGRMWVAPGDPRETPYEEVDLTGVV
jgi:Acyl-coenzyme A:6-aminopenicillanic acid acyl-transferase